MLYNLKMLVKKGFVSEEEKKEIDEMEEKWKELERLHYQVSTLESSSSKEGAEEKKVSKREQRKRSYEEMYKAAEELNDRIEKKLLYYKKKITEEEGQGILKNIEGILCYEKRLLEASKGRVLEGKKPDSKGRPHSISDKDANFIEKGGREKVFGYKPQIGISEDGYVTVVIVPEGNASDSIMFVDLVVGHIENTGVVPRVASVDDGYSSKKNVEDLKEKGVKIVSISGSKGKAVLGEDWDKEEYKAARRIRNRAESAIGGLKGQHTLNECSRVEIENVRAEVLEKVLSYNIRKLIVKRGKTKIEDIPKRELFEAA